MFRHVSKVASMFKYTHFIFSNTEPSQSKPAHTGLLDLEAGIDALLEDRWEESEKVLSDANDPFHAFGRALLVYFQAILSSEYPTDETVFEKAFQTLSFSSSVHCELLTAHAILMFSSLQFLKSSWVEHLKAACDIRKAYKIYERLFEDTLGTSIYDYDPSQPSRLQDPLEHGIYFGLGLFHLVISLLPTKVVKVLGQVKFRSVQSMSNDLLRKASESKTLYSSLASLVLLYYYAHRAMYLSPSPDQAEWIQHTLDRLKRTYSTSPLIALLEIKMTKTKSQLSQCLVRLKATKKIQCRMDEKGPIQSIKEYNVFRLLVLFEMGWLLVFSGHYTEAVETFFCLESTCHWSRLFYHFLSTCCMMAEGSFEKAGREIGQLIQMFEIKRKSGAALSPSEDYAEYKIKRWTETAKTREIPISELLRTQQPLWELVYLWNGVHLWSESLLEKIEQELANRQDPFAHLLLGVIYREKDPVLALAYFDSIVIQEREWVACALYEIALTHSLAGDKQRAADYLKRVVSNDFEWKMCMKIKCQFLFESLGK